MTPRPPGSINAPALVLRVMANILQGPKILLTKVPNGQIESSVGVTVGAVCVVMAPVLFISAAADFWDRGDDGVELLILGLVVGLIAFCIHHPTCNYIRRRSDSDIWAVKQKYVS